MKGFIEKVLMLICVLVPVLIIVGVYGGNLATLIEGGRQYEARFGALEIASAISVLQGGPDGIEHRYAMPEITQLGCVKIYQGYVETSFGYLKSRQGTTSLVERAAFSADVAYPRADAPIIIDCKAGQQLLLRKDAGKISISSIQ